MNPNFAAVDYFAVLSLPPQAALEDEALTQAYLGKSRSAHPDHGGTEEHAAQVNAAEQTLRSPEKRLKHLMDLRAPEDAKAWRTVPLDDSMMTLFSALGKALEASGKFLEKKGKAQSALAKALLSKEEWEQREVLERLGVQVEDHRARLSQELPGLDAALESGESEVWRRLAMIQARFSYLARWQNQIRERLLELM